MRRKLAEPISTTKPQIKQEGAAMYYYVEEAGPYCQPC